MAEPPPAPGLRRVASRAATTLACLVVWVALVAPADTGRLGVRTLLSVPVEGLLLVTLALVLGPRARRRAAVGVGILLGVLLVVKALDLGFDAVLDRPFDPVNDWGYFGPAVGVLGDSIGRAKASAVAAAAVVLVVAVLVLVPLSVLRLTRSIAGHRVAATRAVCALAVVWLLAAGAGALFGPSVRLASTGTAGVAYDTVTQVRAGLADRRRFADEIATDRFRDTSGRRLLTGLRGKDVLLVFVESYGRVAVQDSSFSPGIDAVLDAGTRRLRAVGFDARSAFLTSPTYGAASWLAHATMQSGVWVDSQHRYNQLMTTDRLTLTGAFSRAGWRTVVDSPANTHDWPEARSFYGFDRVYDARNVGYAGPAFGYATMPDQYTLAWFRRHELLGGGRRPVMAEIDLISSHHPWTPLPRLVDWAALGDGAVFDGMPEHGATRDAVFRDPDTVRAAYGRSIELSLGTLISFVATYPDPDLLVVMVGDHQPHSYVTGEGAGHDVPVTVLAHDPAVTARISGWGWQGGLNPGPDAPVWRMDTFRDRFLTAFGPAALR